MTLKTHQPEIYSDSVLSLLPELIYYYQHINNKEKAKYYMDDLAQFPDEDFLLFIHIIDVFDADGLTNYAKQIIYYLVVNENSFSTEKREILDNYLEQLKPNTDNETLLSLRTGFLDMSNEFSIPQISADNIIDVLIDYYDNHKHNKEQNLLLLDELSFPIFITSFLDR